MRLIVRFFLMLAVLLGLYVFFHPVVHAQDVNTFIPRNAYLYLLTVRHEASQYAPEVSPPYYFAGLIEHESCISLTHSKCWSALSQLKTKREEGAGLSQLTRAYNSDGSVRFDTLSDLNKRYKAQLKELTWNSVYHRPDLQIRAMMLLYNESHKQLFNVTDDYERTAMADAAYNGGYGGLKKERLQCSLTAGCDPQRWFSNIERICLKSKKPIYAGRSACDIQRHHTQDVLKVRMDKYQEFFLR